jgi:hypothetical protein
MEVSLNPRSWLFREHANRPRSVAGHRSGHTGRAQQLHAISDPRTVCCWERGWSLTVVARFA